MNNTCPKCDHQRSFCICGTDEFIQEKTCPGCNQRKGFCTCGRRKTNYGTVMNMQYYNRAGPEDYAQTARIHSESPEARRLVEEYYPTHTENVYTWLDRTEKAADAVSRYSYRLHMRLDEPRKGPWHSHTSARMCPVCTPIQLLQMTRTCLTLLQTQQEDLLRSLYWDVKTTNDGTKSYNIVQTSQSEED